MRRSRRTSSATFTCMRPKTTDALVVLNRFDHFEAETADMFVREGVTDTLILGQKGTSEDYGTNTVVVPF